MRFCVQEEYNKVKGSYVMTAKLLNAAARPKEFNGNILGWLSFLINLKVRMNRSAPYRFGMTLWLFFEEC